jgi:hypothetical protein
VSKHGSHSDRQCTLHISVLTLGEIRKGIDELADEAWRMKLVDWLETDLPAFFTGRILPIDAQVVDRWGRMLAVTLGDPFPQSIVYWPPPHLRAI